MVLHNFHVTLSPILVCNFNEFVKANHFFSPNFTDCVHLVFFRQTLLKHGKAHENYDLEDLEDPVPLSLEKGILM